MTYRVDLDIYNGPLDLLLYLIRKEEVEIVDIPIVRITEQYVAYVNLLQALDINIAGDFLIMAATLMEIKSRILLPRPELAGDDEQLEEEEDPRLELIQQLLEYKRFKDAADDLDGLGQEQLRRYSRPPAQVIVGPDEERYALDEMMKDVSLWDLLNAFAKVMRSINLAPTEVIYDDTPIEDLAEQILAILRERRTALFSELFTTVFAGFEQVSRSHLVSAFLAILECIRQRFIAIEQARDFEDLRILWRENQEANLPAEKAAPPEAFITSREEAREAEDVASPEGRLRAEFDTDDIQATEFDEELEAIVVPELAPHKPVYTDDELMGRPESDEQETGAPEGQEPQPEEPSPAENGSPAEIADADGNNDFGSTDDSGAAPPDDESDRPEQ